MGSNMKRSAVLERLINDAYFFMDRSEPMSWICPNQDKEWCDLLKRLCKPAQKGCVLYGKVVIHEDRMDSDRGMKGLKSCVSLEKGKRKHKKRM